jgi:phenylalanyl-tRNA synthetase alpha chain
MYKGENSVLELLSRKKQVSFGELARESGMNEDSLRRIIESLKAGGYAETSVTEEPLGKPTEELERYAVSAFPEVAVFRKALAGASISDLSPEEKSIGLRWAKAKGFITIEAGRLVAKKTADEVNQEVLGMTACLLELKGLEGRIAAASDRVLVEEFFERKLLVKKIARSIIIRYTGKALPADAAQTGFDVSVLSANAAAGKSHPITKITNRMKAIMSELGFEEMEGSVIESSFWNFDALFQPQDHPARELADTFYLKGTMPLPADKALVERVKKAHEDGWKYAWDPKEASRAVLRTHTTALSARYVAAMKGKKAGKYFAIGRVFRNEATDYKHLAEFHQVEGIIAWEGAKFTDLLGILKEFYGKLGFGKIRFRPSFFPYTEPSLEIEVYFEKRKQWLELGGAGIFRPEVSIPLAGIYPVLAWGLSLERPLMLNMGIEDIRTPYRNDMGFLRSARVQL